MINGGSSIHLVGNAELFGQNASEYRNLIIC